MNKNKQAYPFKTTLNLVINERPKNYYPRVIAGALVGALIIGLFCKFAVIDRIAKDAAAWREVNAKQTQLDGLITNNAEYPYILGEYEKYFAASSTAKEYVNCTELLRIIDSRLMPAAGIKSVNYSGNTLTVILTGVDLEQASRILDNLYTQEPLVESITFSTATTSDEDVSAVAMVISMNPEGGDGK